MTAEELKAAFEKEGIKPGSWKELDEKIVPGLLAGQTKPLIKLRDTLEALVQQDQQKLAQLREQLVRLQRGGGV